MRTAGNPEAPEVRVPVWFTSLGRSTFARPTDLFVTMAYDAVSKALREPEWLTRDNAVREWCKGRRNETAERHHCKPQL
jgi:hypothetical protein